MKRLFKLLLLLTVLHSCGNEPVDSSWSAYLDSIGTYSSARVVDLNNDKVLDIVIGAGGKEEVYCDSAVIALDGATGKRLWAIPGINQFVGSPVFIDVNNDQIKDVFIGGRWAQLAAIDGADGKIIWSFFSERKKPDGSDGGWYNFTTPQVIPDLDADGIPDIIIANGGDARAAPGDTSRPAGRLLILGSKTGQILANVVVPDGKETYMSVICEAGNVYFGTGGETIGGHLYRTTLSDVMNGNISNAKELASGQKKGFVSSPVLADINNDGTRDIIVNSAEGKMLAIDGATDSVIWQLQFPGTEAYTMPAIGYFNKDSIPDLFANFAIGTFPELRFSIRFMVDGKTGIIQYQDTIPAFQYASAVAADLNGDGYDEVIVNQSALKKTQFENRFYSELVVFDFINHTRTAMGPKLPATNLASTPFVGDLDHDNKFDIVYCAVQYPNAAYELSLPVGLYIHRFATGKKIKKPILWGAFMGSHYTGLLGK